MMLTAFWLPIKSASAAGNIYYVDSTSGSDSNLGTSTSTAWKTLAKVYASRSNYQPGDSILLKRGEIWRETFNIANQAGLNGSPITYGAYGIGNAPVIDGENNRTFGVYMDSVTNVTVQDIETKNATDGFRIIAGNGDISNILIQRVDSNSNQRHGFSIEAVPGTTHVDAVDYRNDTSRLNGHAGFHAYNVSDGTVGVRYFNSKAVYNGQAAGSHGFTAYFASNIHYFGVESAYTNVDPVTGYINSSAGSEGIGIVTDDFTSNSTITASYSHHNAGAGIVVAHQGSNNTATYNVVSYNGGSGIVVNGNAAGSNNLRILNNTIYGNASDGITAWQPIDHLSISNNIIAQNGGFGIGFSLSGITNSEAKTNIISGNTSGTTMAVPVQTGTINSDPLLSNPKAGNFALKGANSPAVNRGLNLGTSYQMGLSPSSKWPDQVSLLNQNRYRQWEIGAFVYPK